MTKTFKIIALVSLVLIAMSFIAFLLQKNRTNQGATTSTGTNTGTEVDGYAETLSSNPLFAKGVGAVIEGNYQVALDSFEESKKNAVSEREKGIIDFNIADARFNLDRPSGIDDFIALSKNENYEKRTRAMAMLRAYLMYSKYNDPNILLKLALAYDIPWEDRRLVVNSYMEKIYDIYPLAYPVIVKIQYEVRSASTTKEQALAAYTPFAQTISSDIEDMKKNTGEGTGLTSTMLAKANLLSSLYLRFGAVTKEEVEKAYEDLINYDQSKNLKVNMQFALLAYSNFASGAKDYAKADSIINILASSPLEASVIEALSKTSTTTYAYIVESSRTTSNQNLKDLAALIGSGIKAR